MAQTPASEISAKGYQFGYRRDGSGPLVNVELLTFCYGYSNSVHRSDGPWFRGSRRLVNVYYDLDSIHSPPPETM